MLHGVDCMGVGLHGGTAGGGNCMGVGLHEGDCMGWTAWGWDCMPWTAGGVLHGGGMYEVELQGVTTCGMHV